MRMLRVIPATIGLMLTAASAGLGADFLIRTQTFDADPGWTGLRNVDAAIGNDFGFSNTNHTGGTSGPGEAGGTFARTTNVSYYADTNLGGILTLNDPIHASGEFSITSCACNNGVFTGHRGIDAVSTGSSIANFIGFQVSEGHAFAFRAQFSLARSDGLSLYGNDIGFAALGNFFWNYDYDPSIANGQLSLRITDQSGGLLGASVYNLLPEDRAVGATFSAFGIGSGGIREASSTNQMQVFMDNVSYTTALPVPEPASVVLMLLGALSALAQRIFRMVRIPGNVNAC